MKKMSKCSKKKKITKEDQAQLLKSKSQIKKKIGEIAERISKDYTGKCPIFIGVLNGSFIFLADLVRELEIDCEIDFIKISSYEDRTVTSGSVELIKDASCQVAGGV